jgi:hypothetical protein
MVILTQE